VAPDVICEDNVPAFPALPECGRPWVRIVSCNPLEVPDVDIPPVFSGLPQADRSEWAEFRAEYERTHRPMWEEVDGFVRECGAPGLPDLGFIHESPWLNLYVYPAETDYARRRPLGERWQRLESCVRSADGDFQVPDELGTDGSLVYLSLGSLGSADVELMKRLVSVLGETPHRYIVSKGPCHDEYELAPNMWGEEFLPQPAILPRVDLVITHCGNNTTTECFHYGKPMIALPLFWDQYDNAQRVDECGFGVRLQTYAFEPQELAGAVDRLLADDALHGRMGAVAARLQAWPGTALAAERIEQVARGSDAG
jgi:UDP:flavonoid glycosyltransferase YjiC (YdhE family)